MTRTHETDKAVCDLLDHNDWGFIKLDRRGPDFKFEIYAR